MQGSKINGNSSQCWGINYMDSTGYWTLSLVHIPNRHPRYVLDDQKSHVTTSHLGCGDHRGIITVLFASIMIGGYAPTHLSAEASQPGSGGGGSWIWSYKLSCPTTCAMINGLIYVYFYLLSFMYDLKSGDPEIVSLDMVQLLGSMSSNLMGASQNLLVVASAIEDLEENLSTLRLQYNKNIFATNGHAYLIS